MFLAGLGVGLWWITGSFPNLPEGYPGPALFPRMIGVALVAAAVALGSAGLRSKRRNAATPGQGPAWGPPALIVAVVCSFPVLTPHVGVIVAICLICLSGALLLCVPWRVALLVAIGVTAVLYGVFTVLLGIPLA